MAFAVGDRVQVRAPGVECEGEIVYLENGAGSTIGLMLGERPDPGEPPAVFAWVYPEHLSPLDPVGHEHTEVG